MTIEEISNRIDRLYDMYCLESIGAGIKPVSAEQYKQDMWSALIDKVTQ